MSLLLSVTQYHAILPLQLSVRSACLNVLFDQFIYTPPEPNVSGTLQSVRWTSNTGAAFEVSWLPPVSIHLLTFYKFYISLHFDQNLTDAKSQLSATCQSSDIYHLTVNYTSKGTTHSANFNRTSEQLIQEPLTVEIDPSLCWTNFSVAVTYSNAAGSSPLVTAHLPSPQPCKFMSEYQ